MQVQAFQEEVLSEKTSFYHTKYDHPITFKSSDSSWLRIGRILKVSNENMKKNFGQKEHLDGTAILEHTSADEKIIYLFIFNIKQLPDKFETGT